jgi:tetratricopeptide (TPR) repeat protein
MPRLGIVLVMTPVLVIGCAARPERTTTGTLAELRNVHPDVEEVRVEHGLDQAMQGYQRFLQETPETAMTPEAMRRLADLQIEKQFGIHTGDGQPREMAAPERAETPVVAHAGQPRSTALVAGTGPWESDEEFERRTTAADWFLTGLNVFPSLPAGEIRSPDPSGPLEAIALYDRLLNEYPSYENSDKVLYQKARAYAELGRIEEAMETMDRLIRANPNSEHYDEVQFRRGEYLFTRRQYRDAENAYSAILHLGDSSSYYELALYKLGWTLYKQELYEEALHRYMALLDYKVSIGYDFDQDHAEEEERRIADTYRVISLSFSYLGGPAAVREYFSTFGHRSYEDRVYRHLGEHYLAKLRYDDAAKTFQAFVAIYPFHRAAPHFSMHVVDTFTQGGFPKLVLQSKREFATTYRLQSDYWRHFTPDEAPEVLAYLKGNLKDLANHYHAQYQSAEDQDERLASYRDALQWYDDYLDSFPADPDSPPINYQLADLLLEYQDFGEAARQYEHTAYGYAPHPQAAAAGYAAVYAYREQLNVADPETQETVKRDTVASSLRFADAFPEHEHAAAILGAAADDMYEMEEYRAAIQSARRLLETYPKADVDIRRSAWTVVAHGSFEIAEYPQAEQAYAQVLSLVPEDDQVRGELIDNLAASIYKQGELANEEQDYRAAADHFLRIRSTAPTSSIRATAEYDAGAALIRLEDWAGAASVLETFRRTYPEHELRLEATRQIAYAYRENGRISRAAAEYDRLSSESEDPALRSEALLVAGDLYQQTDAPDRALDVFRRYLDEFPQPVEPALEVRLKIAAIYEAAHAQTLYHQELADIVRIEASAGPERTSRTRTVAARSALVLAEEHYREFLAVRLRQPFEVSLEEKQQRMDVVIEAMERLVAYGIADVTAAATYYMAETYFDFSRSLADSERPTDLAAAEMAQYEMVLEEEAFPFEEKAIDLHEENLELLQAGVFNSWTEKSLGRLTHLMPGRYAKNEMSTGFLGAVESYVYRSPVWKISGATSDSANSSPPDATVQPTGPVPMALHD